MSIIRTFILSCGMLLCFFGSVNAETSELPNLGMRVTLDPGPTPRHQFSAIVAVQELGPAWRAGLMPGDLLQGKPGDLVAADQQLAFTVSRLLQPLGYRLSRYTKHEKDSGQVRYQGKQVTIPVFPFEGGDWYDDSFTAIARASREDNLPRRRRAASAFLAEALMELDALECSETGLGPEGARRTHELQYHLTGLEIAAAREPDGAFWTAVSAKTQECREEAAGGFVSQRMSQLEASRTLPLSELVEIPDVGLRLRSTSIEWPNTSAFEVLQVHSILEFSPAWRSRSLQPGDLVRGNARQVLGTIERLRQEYAAGDHAEWQPQVFPLESRNTYQKRTASVVLEPVFEGGRWLMDPRSTEERGRLEAEISDTDDVYAASLSAQRYRFRVEGCKASFEEVDRVGLWLDDLAYRSGVVGNSRGLLHRQRRLGCEAPRQDLLLLLSIVSIAECEDRDAIAARYAELFWQLQEPAYADAVEIAARNLLRDGSTSSKDCVVDAVRSAFLGESEFSDLMEYAGQSVVGASLYVRGDPGSAEPVKPFEAPDIQYVPGAEQIALSWPISPPEQDMDRDFPAEIGSSKRDGSDAQDGGVVDDEAAAGPNVDHAGSSDDLLASSVPRRRMPPNSCVPNTFADIIGGISDHTLDHCHAGKSCYSSCLGILEAGESKGTGFYSLDIDGNGPRSPFAAYCEMRRQGGGWTMFAHHQDCVAYVDAVDVVAPDTLGVMQGDRWRALRDGAAVGLMLIDEEGRESTISIDAMRSTNCSSISDVADLRNLEGGRHYLFWHEDRGCDVNGLDYTTLSLSGRLVSNFQTVGAAAFNAARIKFEVWPYRPDKSFEQQNELLYFIK